MVGDVNSFLLWLASGFAGVLPPTATVHAVDGKVNVIYVQMFMIDVLCHEMQMLGV